MKRSRAWIRPAVLAALLLALSWWLYLEHIDPRYNGRRTSEWLIVLGNGPDSESKQAKMALAALGERAIPQIDRLFFTRDLEWRDQLTELVRDLTSSKPTFEDADSARATALHAIEILGERAAPMLPRLVNSLGDEELKQDAIFAMDAIGEKAIPELKRAMDSPDSRVRAQAVRFLVNGEQPDIVPKLKEMVKDDVPEVRAVSIEALTALSAHDANLLKLLRPLLKDANEGVRACAVNSLGYLAQTSPGLIPEFSVHIKDASALVRHRVTEWLWRFASHDSAAMDAMMIALADPQLDVRACAVSGLCTAGGCRPFYHWLFASDKSNSWGIGAFPGFVDQTTDLESFFAHNEKVLPLLQAHLNTIQGIGADDEVARSLTYIAIFLLDVRYRPFFQKILSEITTNSKNVSMPIFGPMKHLGATSELPDESWRVIVENQQAIHQINPVIAKLIYARLLKMHMPPAIWDKMLDTP